jgi:hypothetical protein
LEKLQPQNVEEKESQKAKSAVRFTANRFRTLRKHLGFTAEKASVLPEVSAPTIYN